jgi:hypothetical protein
MSDAPIVATLQLDASLLWIVLESFAMLTSPGGEAVLRAKYPDMDWAMMQESCERLSVMIAQQVK